MPIRSVLVLIFCFSILSLFSQKPPETIQEYEDIYQKRIQQEYLHQVYIPKDLTEAFIQLNQLIDKESKEKFKRVPEDIAAQKLHFSLGRWIIHNWGFYGGSRLSHHLKSLDLFHPDDMAKFVVVTYHRNLNRTPLNVRPLVQQLNTERKKAEEERAKQGTIIYQEKRIRPKDSVDRNE